MEWEDQGIVLKTSPYGDRNLIITLFTEKHGKHAGMIRASQGKVGRHSFLPGTLVRAYWKARLSEHIGYYRLETLSVPGASFLYDALRFSLLTSATALLNEAFPEHDPHPEVYEEAFHFLKALSDKRCLVYYVWFELVLLHHLGFGLDLSTCAVTGKTVDLAFISPKTGRAVGYDAGAPYQEKLFKFPKVFALRSNEVEKPALLSLTTQEILEGLIITGYFLERYLFIPHKKSLPLSRTNLIGRLNHQLPSLSLSSSL